MGFRVAGAGRLFNDREKEDGGHDYLESGSLVIISMFHRLMVGMIHARGMWSEKAISRRRGRKCLGHRGSLVIASNTPCLIFAMVHCIEFRASVYSAWSHEEGSIKS
jgi:hypothetical protein